MERAAIENCLAQIEKVYDLGGSILEYVQYGEGHINDTFRIKCGTDSDANYWILQRINTEIFQNPKGLMENIAGITAHLKDQIAANGGNPDRETLSLLSTRNGKLYWEDADWGVWRVFVFIGDTVCRQMVTSPQEFSDCAQAFGYFQQQLANYPAQTLFETIERFHDTPNRFRLFQQALKSDPLGRAKTAGREIEFILSKEKECSILMDQLNCGELPLRVTHNDTKLNNILFDKDTGKALCVVDLDTVMPGLVANDFGDSIRFGANHCAEDEQDLTKVEFSLPLFETFTEGFFAGVGNTLTKQEKDSLPWGAKLMTMECGMRFLTDYLLGDTYFKIQRDGQNLDRCRTQFKLAQDMQQQWGGMVKAVEVYSL